MCETELIQANRAAPFSFHKIPLKWAAEIACGGEMALAIGAHGQLFEWGLGKPGLVPGSGELSAPIPNIAAVKIAAGWQHCAAINTQGHLLTWGWGGSQGKKLVKSGRLERAGFLLESLLCH